jgi:hypothetical protein
MEQLKGVMRQLGKEGRKTPPPEIGELPKRKKGCPRKRGDSDQAREWSQSKAKCVLCQRSGRLLREWEQGYLRDEPNG